MMMSRMFFRIPLLLLIAGTFSFGGLVFADPADDDGVILDDWDMLEFTFCPDGDIQHTISFSLYDSGTPISPSNIRLYFYNQEETPSVVFCDDPEGDRSEYFYPTNDYSNHYTVTFGLAAGADTSYDVDWLRMKVEWGPTYGSSDMFPHLLEASPDLSGDLQVNLTDVQLFSAIYSGDYDVRADFNHDDVVNLTDLSLWTPHNTHSCP